MGMTPALTCAAALVTRTCRVDLKAFVREQDKVDDQESAVDAIHHTGFYKNQQYFLKAAKVALH